MIEAFLLFVTIRFLKKSYAWVNETQLTKMFEKIHLLQSWWCLVFLKSIPLFQMYMSQMLISCVLVFIATTKSTVYLNGLFCLEETLIGGLCVRKLWYKPEASGVVWLISVCRMRCRYHSVGVERRNNKTHCWNISLSQ